MDERYYKVDGKRFLQLAKLYCKTKKGWKPLMVLHWVLILIGAAAIIFGIHSALEPTVPDIDAVVLLITAGFILAILPFCFAYVTRTQAFRVIGKPYSYMRRPFLCTTPSGIQFGYHDFYNTKWPANVTVHQIAYENVHHVEIVEAAKLVRVIGRTERIEYINMVENRIAYRFTNGQFGDMADFSFFMAFDDEQAFFDELKAHNITITKV